MYIRNRNDIIKKTSKKIVKNFDEIKISENAKSFISQDSMKAFKGGLKKSLVFNAGLSRQSAEKIIKNVFAVNKKEDELIKNIQNKALNEYAKKTIGAKVNNVSKTTEKTIKNVVSRGIEAGKPRKEIAKELIERIDGMKKSRAMTITRTESANSHAYINNQTLNDLGIKRRWVHVGGGRTDRESHIACDGEEVAGDEIYSCGLSYPHEDGADASEVVNCYCLEIMAI